MSILDRVTHYWGSDERVPSDGSREAIGLNDRMVFAVAPGDVSTGGLIGGSFVPGPFPGWRARNVVGNLAHRTQAYNSAYDLPTGGGGFVQVFSTPATWPQSYHLVSTNNASAGFHLNTASTGAMRWWVHRVGGSTEVKANHGTALAASTWYIAIAWYDPAGTIGLRVYNATGQVGSPASAAMASAPTASDAPLCLNSRSLSPTHALWWPGAIALTMRFTGTPSAAEMDALWGELASKSDDTKYAVLGSSLPTPDAPTLTPRACRGVFAESTWSPFSASFVHWQRRGPDDAWIDARRDVPEPTTIPERTNYPRPRELHASDLPLGVNAFRLREVHYRDGAALYTGPWSAETEITIDTSLDVAEWVATPITPRSRTGLRHPTAMIYLTGGGGAYSPGLSEAAADAAIARVGMPGGATYSGTADNMLSVLADPIHAIAPGCAIMFRLPFGQKGYKPTTGGANAQWSPGPMTVPTPVYESFFACMWDWPSLMKSATDSTIRNLMDDCVSAFVNRNRRGNPVGIYTSGQPQDSDAGFALSIERLRLFAAMNLPMIGLDSVPNTVLDNPITGLRCALAETIAAIADAGIPMTGEVGLDERVLCEPWYTAFPTLGSFSAMNKLVTAMGDQVKNITPNSELLRDRSNVILISATDPDWYEGDVAKVFGPYVDGDRTYGPYQMDVPSSATDEQKAAAILRMAELFVRDGLTPAIQVPVSSVSGWATNGGVFADQLRASAQAFNWHVPDQGLMRRFGLRLRTRSRER